VLQHQGLGDHSAKREREDVDRGESQGGNKRVGIVGHRFDGVGDGSGGRSDAAVVEGDDVVSLGDRVDDPRVPVVQCGGEVDEEDDGDAAPGPEFAVGVGDVAGGHGARRRLAVRSDDVVGPIGVGGHGDLLMFVGSA
jgi:hypothetical protein